ncbi:phenylalanine--tRNA ligase subunit beta [Aliarcobacter thereius]|uniref:Phenylalanine--tRNA ligase beta subunit n=1 Tax=Aliarcobacter thereius LMG 24486 TaxID=1032240 RepID=A0A1C7WMG6_9BACT|nr:phenylalanine--tRNA ligase subunit beta [Aliarcobacter thereius]OCL92146.1 Phenylalanine--tRNA ligase beta subunit [Aliarcobacter thereius]OCL94758.1 Phenylalanine--tRNA ligase beta subunit [Aliarcobacter thereius LMG 24486]QBF15366.1 phenylalanyl-tRNA synthetase, beta subunit [Aliarcobacter thereius LMG 24486]TLS93183.1 phenylalanine--tRNA ligase subunit beta [Aliarcobacter thereius]TLT07945.1 phenylalanine--tRNA ligase subunit beta [Aliarcobacter thereius]
MIVTRKWLEEFINISKISTSELCKTLNSIGLEVDSLDSKTIASNVVVGKVLKKQKHPEADKLNICLVDLGSNVEQIVCGASNVEEGQFVPVAKIGAILGDDFKIKAAKLRGVESNGMICSSTELGLPKLNDGIMILDNSIGELVLGKELSAYPLLNDDIIEIGLTPNRGDCLSILGVARELAAYYNLSLIMFEKHINYERLSIGQKFIVDVSNFDSNLAYKAVEIKNFKIDLLSNIRLATIGKFKENFEIKNSLEYIMHSIGAILNIYNSKQSLMKNDFYSFEVKKNRDGIDSFYSNGEELSNIGVNHKNIIEDINGDFLIEASYKDPETISKLVFDKKPKTSEIFYKTSRGSNPNITVAIDYYCNYLSKFGVIVYSGSKEFLDDIERDAINLSVDKINSIIGQKIDKHEIERILSSLSFEIKDSVDNLLVVKAPVYRHDIKNIADVSEEIIRMIGIDNIKSKPLAVDEVNRVNKTSKDILKRNKVRFKAIENNFFETLTYVFTSKEKLEKYGFKTVKENLDLINPIVKELNTFRTTLLLNLVEACSNNFSHGIRSSAFFEIGTIFDENRAESKKIAFIYSGANSLEDVCNAGKPKNIDFFEFSKKVLNSIGKFDLVPMDKIDNSFIHPFQNANVIIDGKVAGFISKLHPSVCEDYDLNDTFIAQIDFEMIKDDKVLANSYSKFQTSIKDLSILAPKNMEFKDIKKVIDSIKNPLIKQYNLIDIYSDDKLGDFESLTIRFTLQSDEKTLEDEDINLVISSILDILKKDLNITLR